MSKVSWKGGALLAPVPPVLVTCGTMDKPNVLTIGWTGICATHPPMTYISVRPTRYSHDIIMQSGEFVINLTTAGMVRAVDFCGVKSGKNTNKFDVCGLHPEACSVGNTPCVAESPLSLICKVVNHTELGSHTMFLAEIVGIEADERYINANGKLDLSISGLLAYSHGEYFKLGSKVGTFGFSVRKKKNKRK